MVVSPLIKKKRPAVFSRKFSDLPGVSDLQSKYRGRTDDSRSPIDILIDDFSYREKVRVADLSSALRFIRNNEGAKDYPIEAISRTVVERYMDELFDPRVSLDKFRSLVLDAADIHPELSKDLLSWRITSITSRKYFDAYVRDLLQNYSELLAQAENRFGLSEKEFIQMILKSEPEVSEPKILSALKSKFNKEKTIDNALKLAIVIDLLPRGKSAESLKEIFQKTPDLLDSPEIAIASREYPLFARWLERNFSSSKDKLAIWFHSDTPAKIPAVLTRASIEKARQNREKERDQKVQVLASKFKEDLSEITKESVSLEDTLQFAKKMITKNPALAEAILLFKLPAIQSYDRYISFVSTLLLLKPVDERDAAKRDWSLRVQRLFGRPLN